MSEDSLEGARSRQYCGIRCMLASFVASIHYMIRDGFGFMFCLVPMPPLAAFFHSHLCFFVFHGCKTKIPRRSPIVQCCVEQQLSPTAQWQTCNFVTLCYIVSCGSLVPSLSAPVCMSLAVFRTASDVKTGAERLGMRLSCGSLE